MPATSAPTSKESPMKSKKVAIPSPQPIAKRKRNSWDFAKNMLNLGKTYLPNKKRNIVKKTPPTNVLSASVVILTFSENEEIKIKSRIAKISCTSKKPMEILA